MTRNKIIDFLCDQSIDKEKVLFEMLKEGETQFINNSPYTNPAYSETKPTFVNKANCNKCRYYQANILGHYECMSYVAREKCGEPDYKYFEER